MRINNCQLMRINKPKLLRLNNCQLMRINKPELLRLNSCQLMRINYSRLLREDKIHQPVTSGGYIRGPMAYCIDQGRKTHTHSLPTNTMQKVTTDRYDAKHCTITIRSTEIEVQGAQNVVELRYLDETAVLDAVCDFITSRHYGRNCDAQFNRLLNATHQLGETIRTNKERDAAAN